MAGRRSNTDVLAEYIREHRDHQITVCMNVQHGGPEALRVQVDQLQRPYRPKPLGVFVADSVEEALNKLKQAQGVAAAAREQLKKMQEEDGK